MTNRPAEPDTSTIVGEVDPVSRAWGDMRDRQARGMAFRAEDYVNAADPVWTDPERVLDVLYAEYELRAESGDPPGHAEIHERFPHLFDKYVRQIFVHDALEGEVEPAVKVTASTKHAPPRTETLTAGASSPPVETPVFGDFPSVGKYRVITELGRGGQATVYRGFHPDLGRDVVIKISHHAVAPGSEDAIRGEGRALAALANPGIAAVLDFDLHEGRPFLVTEYVDGRSLDKVVAEASLTPTRVAAVMAEIAAAVAAAHGRGLLHLDLKPANVLLGRDGRIRVIDFGLARLFTTETPRHESHAISGTLAYMAPEQATGDSNLLTPRTDVFGLGGVLYFLITGVAPYRGGGIGEVFERILAAGWDRSRLAGCEIPSRLREACEKSMALSPDDRFATATEFAAALSPCQRMRWAKVGAISLSVTVAVLAIWWFGKTPSTQPIGPDVVAPPVRLFPQPVLQVRVFDSVQDRYRDLAYRLPLATGDEVRFEVERPPGVFASLFAIDPDGSVRQLASARPENTNPTLHFPARPDQAAPLTAPGGTVVVLLFGKAGGHVTLEEVKTAAGPGAWANLPPYSVVRVTKDKVLAEGGRGVGPTSSRPDPEGEVLQRLESIRVAMGEFEVVAGVAFSHR